MTATVPYAALSEIAEFFNLNYTDLIEVVDDFEKANPQPADIAPEAPQHCMCPACAAGTIHASDCAVHGIEPGVKGACDCEAAEPVAPAAKIVMKGGEIVKAATYMPGLPDGEHELYAASPATAWGPLTEGERAQAVSEICEHGTGFVAPLFAIIEGIERKLMERNAAPTDSRAGRDAVEAFTDRQCLLLSFAIRFGVEGVEPVVDLFIEHGAKCAVERCISEVHAALSIATGRAAE